MSPGAVLLLLFPSSGVIVVSAGTGPAHFTVVVTTSAPFDHVTVADA